MNKRPALRPGTPLDQALIAVTREILTEARDAIADPALETGEAIHDFRKAVKRWRSFLRLIEPHFGDGANDLRKTARDTAKKLSEARDLKSTLDALEDLREEESELGPRTFQTIHDRLAAMQAAAESSHISPEQRAEIAREVAGWLATVSLWPFSAMTFADIAASLTAGYRRARKAMPENWHKAEDEELHEFRRRVIDYRYQIELFESLWPRMTKVWVDEAQRLRDELGEHRDLSLLLAMTKPHQPLARFRSKLVPAIERRQQAHLVRAAKIAARVFAERPRALQERIGELWRTGDTD